MAEIYLASRKIISYFRVWSKDERLRRLYIEYDAQLRASNAVDFDDLLLLSYRLFQDRPKVAEFLQAAVQVHLHR